MKFNRKRLDKLESFIGNQAGDGAADDGLDQAAQLRAAVFRKAQAGDVPALRLWHEYYSDRDKGDVGPTLSERVQALLSTREAILAELALDDEFLAD